MSGTIARCPNVFAAKHPVEVPTVEPSPAGGLRATCRCGAQWRLSTAEAAAHERGTVSPQHDRLTTEGSI